MKLAASTMRRLLVLLSRTALLTANPNITPGRHLCEQGGIASTHLACLFICPMTSLPEVPVAQETPVIISYSTVLPTATTSSHIEATTTSTTHSTSQRATSAVKIHFPSFDDWQRQVLEADGRAPFDVNGRQHRKRTSVGNSHYEDEAAYGASHMDYLDADERLQLMTSGRRHSGSAMEAEQKAIKDTSVSSSPITSDARDTLKGKAASAGTATPTTDSPAAPAPEPVRTPPAVVSDMKDRFNYASFDCAAMVVASNPEARGANAILFSSKEQYMLTRCNAEKFVVIELCEDILVDTVMIANYEFFSSMFKDIRISVSDRYVPKGHPSWRVLGEYQARNARDLQAFQVANPLIWARYLRIDFLSHYGNEYYCPVSIVKVYGTTMMEEYRREEQAALEAEATSEDTALDIPASNNGDILVDRVQSSDAPSTAKTETTSSGMNIHQEHGTSAERHTSDIESLVKYTAEKPSLYLDGDFELETIAESELDTSTNTLPTDAVSAIGTTIIVTLTETEQPDTSPTPTLLASDTPVVDASAAIVSNTASSTGTVDSASATPPVVRSAAPVSPQGTQESVFRTITKRLAALERNLTLSHRYLEEQSRELNRLFARVEGQFDILKVQVERVLSTRIERQQTQIEALQREIQQLTLKVHLLADEIMFEKRFSFVQLLVIFALVVLVGIIYVPVALWSPGAPMDTVFATNDMDSMPGSPIASPRVYPSSMPVSPYISPRRQFTDILEPLLDQTEKTPFDVPLPRPAEYGDTSQVHSTSAPVDKHSVNHASDVVETLDQSLTLPPATPESTYDQIAS